jgi:hypothetical protein
MQNLYLIKNYIPKFYSKENEKLLISEFECYPCFRVLAAAYSDIDDVSWQRTRWLKCVEVGKKSGRKGENIWK